MPILEKKDVQNPVVRWAKERGILCIRFTPKGDVGWPDHIFVIPGSGRIIWMEFKVPGEVADPIQVYRHNLLRSARQHVYVVNRAELGISILKAELESPRLSEEGDADASSTAGSGAIPRPRAG